MALGDVIARLSVQLGMDTAAFEKGAKTASKQTDVLGDKMEAMGRRTGIAVKGLVAAGAALAGGYIVGQIKTMITDSLEYASSLGEVAAQLGVTTNALQEYRFIATQVGLSQDEMDASLGKLTKSLGEAALGAKAPLEAFQKLGIDARAFLQSGKDAGDAMPLIADGLGKIGTESEKAATLVDIFGKSGQKLLPMLNEGSKAIEAFRIQAYEMGVVLSSEQIQSADETADKISALQEALRISIASAVANNAQAIGELATSLLNFGTAAINAISDWNRFRRAMNDRTTQYYKVDQYLNRRNDLSIAQKDIARKRAREIVDQRVGVQTEESGGLLNVKRVSLLPRAATQATGPVVKLGTASAGTAKALGDVEGGAGKAARGISKVKEESDKTASALDNLMDRLFPEQKELDDLLADRAMIDAALKANTISAEKAAEAYSRLAMQNAADPSFLKDYFAENIEISDTIPKMEISFKKLGQVQAKWSNDTKDAADLAKDSFAEAATSISQSLTNLANSFKGGGILDILGGVLDLGIQLAGAGVFGKGAQTSVLARARGGPIAGGRPYLVGERGPELVVPNTSGRVIPNGALGGGSSVQIVPSPYFDVVVDGRVMRAAPAIAQAGGQVGMSQSARKASRRIA